MEYLCKNPEGKVASDRRWIGEVQNLKRTGDVIETEIKGRRSAMHVIM